MVRRLKKYKKEEPQENFIDQEEEIEDFEDDEEEECEEENFSKFKKFDIDIPLKSDFFETMKAGQGHKIEKLTERFETRMTALEKEIICNLRENGINVSEEIRKMILKLDRSLVERKKKSKYTECSEELEKNLILIENLKISYSKIKTLRGNTKEEAQDLVNKRFKIKYEIDNLMKKNKSLKIFLNKYNNVLRE